MSGISSLADWALAVRTSAYACDRSGCRYTRITGTTQLPPMFAIAYHQCRWNYKNEEDVFSVDAMFEELDFPYDVLWLDIEHTDGAWACRQACTDWARAFAVLTQLLLRATRSLALSSLLPVRAALRCTPR